MGRNNFKRLLREVDAAMNNQSMSPPRNFYNYPHAQSQQFQGAKVRQTPQGDIYKVNYPQAVGKGLLESAKDLVLGGTIGKGFQRKLKVRSYKRGGKVRKTGLFKLHKGERVLTKKQTKNLKKNYG